MAIVVSIIAVQITGVTLTVVTPSYLLQVYVCTVECDPVLAAARNVHKRSEAEVVKLARAWEDTPGKMNIFIRSSLSSKWCSV